jgi:hemolysin III
MQRAGKASFVHLDGRSVVATLGGATRRESNLPCVAYQARTLKEPVSPWPHAIGFVLAVIGFGDLIARFHQNVETLAVMSIYGLSLLAAFGSSALYHWVGGTGPRQKAVFRRMDHASIYALIAGTYTPVLYFGLNGAWRVGTLTCVWVLALIGIAQTMWFVDAPRALSTGFYVALGWLAVVPSWKLAGSLSHPAIVLLILGGLLYTLGGVIYATRSFNLSPGRFGFHEVFHIFVIAGAAAHFAAIAFFLTPS